MPSIPLVAVLLTAGLAASAVVTVAAVASSSAVPEPQGHLILQIEGDARALRVTHITPKVDPCGPARFASAHAVVVRDAAGSELGRVPLDLSNFDLDPTRIGGALTVQGCMVRDPQVATLVSIPRWPTAASLDVVHAQQVLGTLASEAYAALVTAGERR